MIVFIYCCFLFLLLMYHRNRTLLALDIYVFVLSNGHRLHSPCSHHPGRSRLDRLQGPLDYCKWFPLYGPLCSGVGILAFGSASKFPISMAKDEEATSCHPSIKVAITWCITTPAYSFAFPQF